MKMCSNRPKYRLYYNEIAINAVSIRNQKSQGILSKYKYKVKEKEIKIDAKYVFNN